MTGLSNRSLAASLEPVLISACEGHLQNINWFRTDWQRGGAATGFTSYMADGVTTPAVVKLPVVERELRWTRRLQENRNPAAPRLFASGEELGGYDLAWMVIERFEHGPLGLKWHDDHIVRIAEAVASFSAAASRFPADQPGRLEDWPDMLEQSVRNVRLNQPAETNRWLKALKDMKKRLGPMVELWRDRGITEWLHGDIHLANAMSRTGMDHGDVALIDMAEIHCGHWCEDAVYLERQLWARPTRLAAHNPVREIARARRRHGLPVEERDFKLAEVRRTLLAATAPCFIRSEGHPKHLAACLDHLEHGLATIRTS